MSNKLRSFLIVVISIAVVMVALPMNAFRVSADSEQTIIYYYDGECTSPIEKTYDTTNGPAKAEDPANIGYVAEYGYTFAGWTDESAGTVKKFDVGDDLPPTVPELYAVWTYDSTKYVEVTLEPNDDGSCGEPKTILMPKTTGTVAPKAIPFPADWKVPNNILFVHWHVNIGGIDYTYTDGQVCSFDANVTLNAIWDDAYVITYDANDGSNRKIIDKYSMNATDDYQVKPDTLFTREGYNFTGWFNTSGSSSNQYGSTIPNGEIDSDIKIYAHWEFDSANYFKVTYNANGGSGSECEQCVAKNSTDFNLINQVENKKITAPEGKQLAGWNTQADGKGTPYEITQQITTQDVDPDIGLVLFAQWEPIPCEVKFMSENGSAELDSVTVDYGETPSFTKTTPTKEKTEDKVFVFDGWSTAKDSQVAPLTSLPAVTKDTTYYAHFKEYPRYYTITANDPAEGGTVSGSGSVEWNEPVTVTVSLANGYRVKNWIDNGSDVASDATTYTIEHVTEAHTVEVVLEKKPCTVSVSATEGGTATLENSDLVYGDPAKVIANASEGYTFVNWIENGNEVSTSSTYSFTVESDRNLTAVFKLISYDISLSSDGHGSVSGGGTYNHFSTAELTASPDTGYYFVNWTDEDGDEVSTSAAYSFMVSGARSLKANFARYSYNIGVTAGDNGSVTGEGIYYYGESITVKAKPDTGYHFVNWTSNGNVVSTNANYTFTVSGPTELTANFAINTYTVKFVNDDGTLLREGQFVYGSTAFYQVNATPTKKATAQYTYTFAGWDKKLGTVTEDITYTAVYDATVNKYKITFQNEDGSVLQTSEVEYGKLPIFEKGTPTKASTVQESFTFAGWDKDIAKVTGEAVYTATYTAKKITRDDINYLHFTVSFESNGGSEVVSQLVADGGVAFKPEEPMRERYTFGGWYIDAALTKPFSFSTPITSDITLYAKWIKGSPEVEATYAVVGLGSMTWTEGSDEDFSVTIERSKENDTISSHFKGVQIDGVDLDYYLYELSEENGTVIIRSDAFDDLDAGTHTITIVYDDGTAEAELVISKEDKTVETSDEPTPTEAGGGEPEVLPTEKPSLLGLWIALAVVGGVLICVLPIIIIKRRGVK